MRSRICATAPMYSSRVIELVQALLAGPVHRGAGGGLAVRTVPNRATVSFPSNSASTAQNPEESSAAGSSVTSSSSEATRPPPTNTASAAGGTPGNLRDEPTRNRRDREGGCEGPRRWAIVLRAP